MLEDTVGKHGQQLGVELMRMYCDPRGDWAWCPKWGVKSPSPAPAMQPDQRTLGDDHGVAGTTPAQPLQCRHEPLVGSDGDGLGRGGARRPAAARPGDLPRRIACVGCFCLHRAPRARDKGVRCDIPTAV